MFTQFAAAVRHSLLAISYSTVKRWLFLLWPRVLLPCCAIMLAAGGMTAATGQTLGPGQMKGWGYGGDGQTQLPTVLLSLDDISAIAASYDYTAALRNNGTIVVWGRRALLVASAQQLVDITAIAASKNFLMALRRNGTVAFSGSFSQDGPFGEGFLTDVIAIAASETHAMALKRDGKVIDWRVSDGSLIEVPAGLPVVTAIAAGEPHSLALLDNGSVSSWGHNGDSALDVPFSVDKFVAITAAYRASYALRMNGSVAAWGVNTKGLLDGVTALTDIKALSAGRLHVLAVNGNDEVQAWGDTTDEKSNVPLDLKNVKAVATGPLNSFALNPAPLLKRYTFSGFQPPVDTAPVVNLGKAGRTYPVKWQLKDQDGNFVSALTAVKSVTLASVLCGTYNAEPGNAIEIETTGETMLRYNAGTNQFIYNWKTPREPNCYKLFVTLDNNDVFTAKFNLTK